MNMSKDRLKKAYVLNLITFALITFSCIWMFSGIHFGYAPAVLEGSRLRMLKYYTVDSNILMGIIALVAAIIEKRLIDGKIEKLPGWLSALKLVGVVGVTLTMLVTVFFLTPTMGFFACFNNSNVLLHAVNPILSIVGYICYENTDSLSFKHTFTGVSSMLVYAVYYISVAVMHSHNNVVDKGYDWYGFLVMGVNTAVFIVPLLILITYLISFALWKFNRLAYKRNNK